MAATPVGSSAPVHLILGEDSYLAEQALERVLAAVVGEDRAEAVTVFHGDEARWDEVLAAARSGSLFAARRAVVVRRADQLRGSARGEPSGRDAEDEEPAAAKKKGRGDEDPVLRYLSDPAPDATLVLLADRPDRRRNPWRRLAAEATVHAADPKKGAALRTHVEQELRRRRLSLDAEALRHLIEEVGQDLRRLIGEIDKLEAWADGRKETIGADDVHAVLGRGLGRPLYLLADAVAGRDLPRGLERLVELLEGGEEPLRILATLHRALRQVRAAAAMREARASRAEIAARLLPQNMQFKADALLDAARRWRGRELELALAALDQADRRIKTGSEAGTTLVAAVVACCGGGRAATSPRPAR